MIESPQLRAIFLMLREELKDDDIPHRTTIRELVLPWLGMTQLGTTSLVLGYGDSNSQAKLLRHQLVYYGNDSLMARSWLASKFGNYIM